ncbi:thioesterase [Sulfobacillus acidophilus DSM 10332]|uniref:Thioesterase n=1 Tax=Sulfobacillus acidophilus (strain ATCC 700253 / DSM 10332 / NAL) TaxID=679936 RepID=G8TW72_SULAD|nr:thioesterase [Sulfobacillus acidophilus DSM 10332]
MSNSPTQWETVVRWAECDAAGIIYHARVFDWFSEARVSWLAEHALSYYHVLRPQGVELLVKSAHAHFRHALAPGDRVRVTIRLQQITPTRATFHYEGFLWREEWILALEGETDHAFVQGGRAQRLDRRHPDIYQAFCESLEITGGMRSSAQQEAQ